MWKLSLHSPEGKPREHILKAGWNTIGRDEDRDFVVTDLSASRKHAEIFYDASSDLVSIRDVGSTNGTYVNREMLVAPRQLFHDDVIRIGVSTITVINTDVEEGLQGRKLGTRTLNRDFLLESLDRHAILMYEVAQKLNTVLDLDIALQEVSEMLRRTVGADRCQVIVSEQFHLMGELGFPTSIARKAIEERVAVLIPDLSESMKLPGVSASLLRVRSALCVPIMSAEEVIGLLYLYKTDPTQRPFDGRDLQLAVAISHQTALTIQRMRLLEQVREEQRMRQMLERFVPPPSADNLYQGYMKTGLLAELSERVITVLFADIVDSTGLAERLPARQFGEVLSNYYQLMTDIIFEYGGLMDKYLGDGMMAVFGMDEDEDPEGRAVQAGLKMIEAVKSLSLGGREAIHIGLGVNTGRVVAGYVRTRQRLEFTVLGDAVNVASGLQLQARPDRIFIGPGTASAVLGRFQSRPVGSIPVKGRDRNVQAFEVLLGEESLKQA
jgi:adenylate cyclase